MHLEKWACVATIVGTVTSIANFALALWLLVK
jgi:hypothetical protein